MIKITTCNDICIEYSLLIVAIIIFFIVFFVALQWFERNEPDPPQFNGG